jgi:hypothetical protein
MRNFTFLIVSRGQQDAVPARLLFGSSNISITVGKFIKNQDRDREDQTHIIYIRERR